MNWFLGFSSILGPLIVFGLGYWSGYGDARNLYRPKDGDA